MNLETFAALPLVDMARTLAEMPPIAPCKNCGPTLCWIHRQEQDWHRALSNIAPPMGRGA